MNFDQYIQYRALNTKAHVEGQAFNAEFTDRQLEKAAANGAPEIKTVCAPISIELFERLTTALSILDISKRSFIEAAIIEALDRADAIMAEIDIFENQYPPAEVIEDAHRKAMEA